MVLEKNENARQVSTGGEREPAGVALGNNTKLGHTSDEQGKLDKLGKALKSASAKGWRDNYTLADVAHAIIRYYENNSQKYKGYMKSEKVPSFSRNTICGNILEDYSAVKRTIEHGSYVQTNIAHCGNIWLCPVCASLIQSRRADEVQEAISWAENQGHHVVMITYTASHYANLPLMDFGTALQKAYRNTMKQVHRLRKKHEVGNIKAVEFTYSERNRWHKHFHVIYILDENCHVGQFYEMVKNAWELQCANVGLLDISNEKAVDSFRKHSCSLSVGSQAVLASYTNKSAREWTIADEMAKSVLKIGRNNEHMTPFQMLATIATTDDKVFRQKLINAFIEYAIHTKGLHQMDWSNGLKVKVGIADLTDEEIAEEKEDTAVVVAGLTVKHWHLLRSKYLRIKYFKMLKTIETPEDAYSKIVQFFYENANNENEASDLCCTVLNAEQTQLLEDFYDMDNVSADEMELFYQLRLVVELASEECNSVYRSEKKKFSKISSSQRSELIALEKKEAFLLEKYCPVLAS